MAQEIEEKEIYVYLDFQGKDTSRILQQDSLHFRMLNLKDNKPIVEIGDDVYEGTYDDAIGTNLFFKETSNDLQSSDLFEPTTPISLEYLLKQSKIIKLKQIGTRKKVLLNMPETETVNTNITDDYRILLEKFENKKLNIDDYITKELQDENLETLVEGNTDYEWELTGLLPKQNRTSDCFKPTENNLLPQSQPQTPIFNPIHYTKLQKIAEQPTRRIINEEFVDKTKQHPILLGKYDFIVWKNLMMQKVESQHITIDVRRSNIEDFVDIEQSIQAGFIQPSSEQPRIFTNEEKSKLLSFENFANVSPLMKLIMLQDYEDMEKAALEQMLPDELNEVGQDGYTHVKRYDLIKDFRKELQTFLVNRLREHLEKSDEASDDINLNVSLSDNEIAYFSSSSDNDEIPIRVKLTDDNGVSNEQISESDQA